MRPGYLQHARWLGLMKVLVSVNREFLPSCQSDTGVRLSTRSYFDKVVVRHSHEYHPLMTVQAWIRLPFGSVGGRSQRMAAGCVLDAAGKGNGALCQLSVIGAALMRTAPAVLEGALRPDLRHWEHVLAAFVVTRASKPELEPCLPKIETAVQRLGKSVPPARFGRYSGI